jgi:hypothetical protein
MRPGDLVLLRLCQHPLRLKVTGSGEADDGVAPGGLVRCGCESIMEYMQEQVKNNMKQNSF